MNQQMNYPLPDWRDLEKVRNWIISHAYAREPKPLLRFHLLGALGFILAVRFALFFSQALAFQFMIGSALLYGLAGLLKKVKPQYPVLLSELSGPLQQAKLQPEMLGIWIELFGLRAVRHQDFPLQQNALLVLVLIWIQQSGFGVSELSLERLGLECAMGVLYVLQRMWQENRNQSTDWLAASRAIDAYLSQ